MPAATSVRPQRSNQDLPGNARVWFPVLVTFDLGAAEHHVVGVGPIGRPRRPEGGFEERLEARVVDDHLLAAHRAHRGVRHEFAGAEAGAVGDQGGLFGDLGQHAHFGLLDPPTATGAAGPGSRGKSACPPAAASPNNRQKHRGQFDRRTRLQPRQRRAGPPGSPASRRAARHHPRHFRERGELLDTDAFTDPTGSSAGAKLGPIMAEATADVVDVERTGSHQHAQPLLGQHTRWSTRSHQPPRR